MKKILTLLLTLAMAITMLPMVVGAEGEKQNDIAPCGYGQKCCDDKKENDHNLITLVTCAYHTDNGRFVVVARRK